MTSVRNRRPSPSPTSSKRRRGFVASASLSALLVIGGAVLGTASPAAAHDELLSTYPEASATIPTDPAEISLTFTGKLQTLEGATVIEVIAEDGSNLADGAPEITEATVTQHLSDQPVVGEVTVRWRVVSSDGHPISDEYTFTVEAMGTPSASPTPTNGASQTEESTETATPTAESGSGDIHSQPGTDLEALPILVIAGGAALLGSAALLMVMAGRDRRRRDWAAQQAKEDADES